MFLSLRVGIWDLPLRVPLLIFLCCCIAVCVDRNWSAKTSTWLYFALSKSYHRILEQHCCIVRSSIRLRSSYVLPALYFLSCHWLFSSTSQVINKGMGLKHLYKYSSLLRTSYFLYICLPDIRLNLFRLHGK